MNSFLILAGGASTRMGVAKGLMKFQEHTWLERQLLKITEYQQNSNFQINEVLIVLGYHFNDYLKLLIPLKNKPILETPISSSGLKRTILKFDYKIVNNPRPERGSFSSLQCGLQEISKQSSGVFILPIDVPAPKTEVIEKMFFASKKAKVIIPTYQASSHTNIENSSYQHVKYNKGGHPVWIAKPIINKILEINANLPESRLDFIIKNLPANDILRILVTDANVIKNINTPTDFTQYSLGEL